MNKPDDNTLLCLALTIAEEIGYAHVTREGLATLAQVSPALISVRFGTMTEFRRKLMRYAVRVECLPVIAQGLAAHDPHAKKARPSLQRAALNGLLSKIRGAQTAALA